MLNPSFSERFESALLSEGIITSDQLYQARKITDQLNGSGNLIDVLVDMHWVSRRHLDELIQRERSKLKIGEILVARRLITDKDVKAALDLQRTGGPRPKRIGEILIEMNLIDERHVVEALSEKFGLPVIDPDISLIDTDLFAPVSIKYLRKQTALPIKLEEGLLRLLVADPTRTNFVEEIGRIFKCKVVLGLATTPVIVQTLGLIDSLIQSKEAGIHDYQKVKYHTLETQPIQAGDDRVVQMVDQLIGSAIEEGASDVHLEPMANKLRIRYRIDGVLVHKMDFPREYTPRIVSRIKILADADVAERRKHQDGRIFVKTEK